MQKIVALIDFSDVTTAVVKNAREMARAFQCELLLLHVSVPPSELMQSEAQEHPPDVSGASPQRQLEILGLALKKEGINAVTQVIPTRSSREHPAAKILEEIARLAPDLVILGSHGHGRLHQLLAGSVTDTVIRKARCPILIIPSQP